MKALKIVCLFWVFVTLQSCSKSDHNTGAVPTSFQGTWKLVEVSGGIAGIHETFPSGQITWSINTANQTITVVNNNTNTNLVDILETGVYNYTMVSSQNPTNCYQIITVNGITLGCVTYTNNQLNFDYQFADGYNLKFIR